MIKYTKRKKKMSIRSNSLFELRTLLASVLLIVIGGIKKKSRKKGNYRILQT